VLESTRKERLPVIEMKLVHQVHRAATALLASAAARAGAPSAELAQLRDFLVAALRHHHQSEDDALWPTCETIEPGVAAVLRDLSAEHRRLDAALDTLDIAPIGCGPETELLAAAVTVRELVRDHLAHEEQATVPVLRRLTDTQWAEFSRFAMQSAPAAGAHLQIGFMDEEGDPDDVAAVLAGLPDPVAQALPALRDQARKTLDALRAGQGPAS
jgi:iron-sulfur cluster repair protein YtfE (RIC family)